MSAFDIKDRTRMHLVRAAKAVDCRLIVPHDFELIVDIDAGKVFNDAMYNRMEMDQLVMGRLDTVSRNGNKHVYVRLQCHLTLAQRVALQLLLGSDPIKELLSIQADMLNAEIPTAMFETPEEYGNVVAWREDYDDGLF